MKKALVALAVLGLSGAALAQSSVTLFGIADAGVGRIKTPALKAVDGSGKTEFVSGSAMNNADSAVGVRGIEDLGGGSRAGFWFESAANLGTGATLDKYSGGGFWTRSAFVYLGSDTWGTVKLGRMYNQSFLGITAWELTGSANYTLVGNTYGYTSNGPRTNSEFAYRTPKFGGVINAEVGYVTKNDVPSTTVPAGKSKWDMNVIYADGPVVAAANASKLQTGKTQYTLGGRYDFGSFIVAASYSSGSRLQVAPVTLKTVRRGFGLGGTAIFGPLRATLDVTRDTKNQWTTRKYTNYLAELKYSLSKRTFLYGVCLRLDGYNNYILGVRHNF